MSSSEIERSQLRTWRNSLSILPTSRLPKTPVHNAQWTFRRVESFVYCREEKYVSIRRAHNGSEIVVLSEP